jgi:hypothetical protein
MCLLWKLSLPFLVKPASSVKSTRLLKKGLHHVVEGTTDKIIGVGKNQVDLELVPVVNGTGTATVHEEPAAHSAACIRRMLVRGFSTRISMHPSTPTVCAHSHLPQFTIEGQTVPVSQM